MGATKRGQGNMQVLVNMLDLGANVQAAGDMARFSHNQVRNELQTESQLFALVGSRLKDMGHKVASSNGSPVGGFEAIMFTPDAGARGDARPRMRYAPRRSRASIERGRIFGRTARRPGIELSGDGRGGAWCRATSRVR
jgi:gamma-glutamyltranspeptidase